MAAKPDALAARLREIDALAAAVRARAGVGGAEIVPSPIIVSRILGPTALKRVEWLRSKALISWAYEEPRIFVRAGLGPIVDHVVAHELGHWAFRAVEEKPYRDGEEYEANVFAGALLMPRGLLKARPAEVRMPGFLASLRRSEVAWMEAPSAETRRRLRRSQRHAEAAWGAE